MSYHESSGEQERQETIKCFIGAFVLVVGAICAMLFGFAWLSTAEKVSADIYGAKHLEIEWAQKQVEYDNHVHPETNKGFTGKPIGTR